MNDIIRWVLRLCLQGVLWVFLLSIRVDGRVAFDYAHDFFVKNSLVETVDSELAELWQRLARSVKNHEKVRGERDQETL